MATRTVRLDTEAEATLREIRQATGLPISEAFKRGLRSLHEKLRLGSTRRPYDVYKEIDIGPGGFALGPSTATRREVRRAIRRKLRR
jgi:hypothetical protein